jgi:Reverse transcriptase (RNA-dependent DNA polymerase)
MTLIVTLWQCLQSDIVNKKFASNGSMFFSSKFSGVNGTRQGGILSLYLLTRYIRELVAATVQSNIGCNIGGVFCNIFAYADDLVLLAPSWRAMQSLINLLSQRAQNIVMTCNADKTVCTVFNPKCRRMIIVLEFPNLTIVFVEQNLSLFLSLNILVM